MPKTLTEAASEYAKHTDGDSRDFIAGAEWMRQQFSVHGTDYCCDCETGRATMYVTFEGRCIECAHKRERSEEERHGT